MPTGESPRVFRLSELSRGPKVLCTAFVTLVALGYLSAAANIYLHHADADLEPALGLGDLQRVYHGLERPAPTRTAKPPAAPMLKVVLPGGKMRKHLERGGEESVRSLIAWLEAGAPEAGFTNAGDPSPQDVLAENCVKCHNSKDGEKNDVPYASDRDTPPSFALVAKEAEAAPAPSGPQGMVYLPPMTIEQLVQVTHVHILSIPVFALCVAILFWFSGVPRHLKGLLLPVPMLATLVDIASWWLARPIEPFVFVIGAAGVVFGSTLALQIGAVLWSLWIEKGEKRT
jgi:hypothetical protein